MSNDHEFTTSSGSNGFDPSPLVCRRAAQCANILLLLGQEAVAQVVYSPNVLPKTWYYCDIINGSDGKQKSIKENKMSECSIYVASSTTCPILSIMSTIQVSQAPLKPGQLTILGSGISSIGQLTLQAVAHIEQADVVFYVLSDPATEAFIQQKNSNCVDLYTFYDNGKARMDTYVQMSEVISKFCV